MTIRSVLLCCVIVCATGASARATVRRVPQSYRTIQAAVDAASPGDVVDVGRGAYCGATIDVAVSLIGHGATIIGCNDGPVLFGDLRVGFYLPGADGASAASGTRVEGFVFDGGGVSPSNLDPLALGVFARFANDVHIEGNVFLGTVQAITNTAGDRWWIARNKIQGLTLFDCTTDLCAGGDGIVVQVAHDDVAAAGGPGAAINRPSGNVVVSNDVAGAIPDGFSEFSMAGVFVFAADDTLVTENHLDIPDNPAADASGDGVLVSDACCGEPAVSPGARRTAVIANNGRGSQFAVVVEGTGGANTGGLLVRDNAGAVQIEGKLVFDGGGQHRLTRLDSGRGRHPLF